jgi:hypothetical protein
MFSIARRTLRILDFDTECRPMHYNEWRPESQITAIAWSWVGSPIVKSAALKQSLVNEDDMLERFLEDYDKADMVQGHYIRKHDLPLLSDHVLRSGLGRLASKLTQDTQADLVSVKSLGKSQDNLAMTFDLAEEKHHMTGADWREANSLSPEGTEATLVRVISDVIQHKALTARLLEEGLLSAPRIWYP